MVMTTIVGRPDWFGLSMPRQYSSMLLNNRWWWTIILLSVVYRDYGWRAVVVCIGFDWRYVYEERHGMNQIHVVSAVDLTLMLRREHRERERAMFLSLTDSGFNRIVKATPLHPLTDRDPNPWPTVRAVTVVSPSRELSDSLDRLREEWAQAGIAERITA